LVVGSGSLSLVLNPLRQQAPSERMAKAMIRLCFKLDNLLFCLTTTRKAASP
jgi:hypothetical protein